MNCEAASSCKGDGASKGNAYQSGALVTGIENGSK